MLFRSVLFQAIERPQEFAELVTSEGFHIWAVRGLFGSPMETIGVIALFLGLVGTEREKLAFWGMLLCIIGDLFGTSMFVVTYFIFPEVGQLMTEGIEAAASVADLGPMMPLFGATLLASIIGLVLFAIAIWKAEERFPKWSGIVVAIGFTALLIQTSYIIQILANVIWGSAYLWMAVYSWNKLPE